MEEEREGGGEEERMVKEKRDRKGEVHVCTAIV